MGVLSGSTYCSNCFLHTGCL